MRSLRRFLRHSQRDSVDVELDGDEEKDDGCGRGGRRSRRSTRRFFVGQWLDVKDTVNNWLEATVMDMADSGESC